MKVYLKSVNEVSVGSTIPVEIYVESDFTIYTVEADIRPSSNVQKQTNYLTGNFDLNIYKDNPDIPGTILWAGASCSPKAPGLYRLGTMYFTALSKGIAVFDCFKAVYVPSSPMIMVDITIIGDCQVNII